MPITNYKIQQGENGAGTPAAFNLGEHGDTHVVPPQPQVDTVTVVTGDATGGWVTTVTNSTNGESVAVTYSPVDTAGAPSAVAADAAIALTNAWNSNTDALIFGRATRSGAVVTLTFNDPRFTFVTVTVEGGIGAATDAILTTAAILNTEFGVFAFRPTDAAVAAGADPRSLVTADGAIIEQLVGGVVKRLGQENPSLDTTLTFGVYQPSQNIPVMARGILIMPCSVAMVVGDTLQFVDSAPAVGRVGWVTNTGGVTIPATSARVYQGGPAGGVCKVQFTLA